MRATLVLVLAALGGCAGLRDSFAPATPQRPTISSDTSTTAEGTFEFEAGSAIDPGDSVDTPTLVKWGAGPRTEMFAGWSPYQEISLVGPDADGVSDLLVGTRHRVADESDLWPSAAVQLATKLPTGDQSQGLSSGEIDFKVAAIFTKNFTGVTTTAYWEAGVLGNPTGGTDLEHVLAFAGGTAVSERVGVFGELAAVLNHENDIENYLAMAGGSYAVSPSLIFDLGAVVGLNDEAPDFQIVFGLTSNLGRPAVWVSR